MARRRPTTGEMETQLEQKAKEDHRARAVVVLLIGFVAPFAVLMLSGVAEAYARASYALFLGVLMAWAGVWVAFRAGPEELVKRWTPHGLKPLWAIAVRACGLLVIVGAGYLLTSTIQDVGELLSSGHPRTFVEAAHGIERKGFLHPVFQTVRLRGGGRFRTVYLFAYGGKRLVEGQRYAITVLPRSHWILSAHEVTETASQ
jgi:hypothetical protein